MNRRSQESNHRASKRSAIALLAGLFCLAPAVNRACGAADEPLSGSLPTLQRIVRYFDFEEDDAAPNSLPAHFYRYIAPSQGFPPFGNMKLSSNAACSGISSFEFDLGGGSMSARVGTSIIPILPLVDYVVSVKVRTEGLNHARARIVAWLHDKTGQPLHSSRVQSRLTNTNGQWEALTVDIRGNDPQAADLVVELQVVQPAQFDIQIANPDQPRLEDISGRVWFDDVIVSHLPRISLTMAAAGNVVRAPQTPELNVLVNELTSEALTARLRVVDLDGRTVLDSTFPAPRGRQGGTIRVPVQACGWYRAVLDVTSKSNLAQRHWLDFVVLPAKDRRPSAVGRFGIVLHDMTPQCMNSAPELTSILRSGSAIVPVWDFGVHIDQAHDHHAALRDMIDRFLVRHVDLIFSLNVIPDQVARSLGIEKDQLLALLAKDPRQWRGGLDDLLVNFGLEVSRWQIGSPGSDEAFWARNLPAIVDGATRSFADFVPEPRIYTTWSVEQAAAAQDHLPAYSISLPYQMPAEGVEEYAGLWLESDAELMTVVQQLPADAFSPRQRLVDLAVRTLHAWRAKLPTIAIAAPWHGSDDDADVIMPEPAFALWRGLAEQLNGREFVAELPLPAGQHCWILRGQHQGDAALAAWTDNLAPASADRLQSQLSAEPVEIIDPFGNSTTVNPVNGIHTIRLRDIPVIINNVSLELVEFRSGFHIDPSFVPAVAKVHEHQIVLHNPWKVVISGTIRVNDDAEWRLSPLMQEFVIPPGGEARLPLNIIPQRSVLAGRKRVEAEITLHAEQTYTMTLQTEMEVGLKDIDLVASWRTIHNPQTGQDDLVVTEAITNKGKHAVNLDVDLLAPGISQTRRTVAGLGPGETAVRSFRIANGMMVLGGKQVRLGVAERDGGTRLNHLLSIVATAANPVENSTAAAAPSP